jgi:hypothetical protein
MAKVLDPLRSSEARGKVGGTIYNTCRGIKYVKVFTSPKNPKSVRQLLMRGFLTTCSRAWSALTGVQRTGWGDWAFLRPIPDWTGNSIILSGYNAYVALSTRLLDMGKTVVATAPVAAGPATPANVVATGASGQISFAFTAYGGTATTLDIWLEGPMSVGRVGSIRQAAHKQYGPGETTPMVVTGLTPGFYTWWARALSETDGQASSWVTGTATVA